jgi:hypothetical protein
MSAYYFDSSALVKYYAPEIGTNWVRGLVDVQPANEIFTALVTGVEIVAAMWGGVGQRIQDPSLSLP